MTAMCYLRLRHRSDERAALLAELLLALSLIVAVLVLVAGIFPYSYTVDQKAWKKSSAHRLAGSTLERLRGQKFEDLAGFSNTVTVEETPYQVTVTVSDATAAPVKSKRVECRITWSTPNGQESYSQDTLIAKIQRPL